MATGCPHQPRPGVQRMTTEVSGTVASYPHPSCTPSLPAPTLSEQGRFGAGTHVVVASPLTRCRCVREPATTTPAAEAARSTPLLPLLLRVPPLPHLRPRPQPLANKDGGASAPQRCPPARSRSRMGRRCCCPLRSSASTPAAVRGAARASSRQPRSSAPLVRQGRPQLGSRGRPRHRGRRLGERYEDGGGCNSKKEAANNNSGAR